MSIDRTIIPAASAAGAESSAPGASVDPRLQRLRWVAWLLDRSIPLGNGWRVGLDPLIGLIPGVGDFISTAASFYILYEAGRMGLPSRLLGRMVGNIAIDTLVGAVPVVGDLFDFAWQANVRNLRLIEAHYSPHLPERPAARLMTGLIASAAAVLVLTAVGMFFLLRWIIALLS